MSQGNPPAQPSSEPQNLAPTEPQNSPPAEPQESSAPAQENETSSAETGDKSSTPGEGEKAPAPGEEPVSAAPVTAEPKVKESPAAETYAQLDPKKQEELTELAMSLAPPPPPTQRGFKILWAIIAAALILVIVALTWRSSSLGGGGGEMMEEAARRAPRTTLFMAAVDVRQAEELQKKAHQIIALAATIPSVRENFASSWPRNLEIDFLKEVAPHLEGAGAWIIDSDLHAEALTNPETIKTGRNISVLIHPLKAEEPVKALCERIQKAWQEDHPGVTYLNQAAPETGTQAILHAPQDQRGFSWTIYQGVAYVGTSYQDLVSVLKPRPAGESLADNPLYQQALAQAPKQGLWAGHLFLNLQQLAQLPAIQGIFSASPEGAKFINVLEYALLDARLQGGSQPVLHFNGRLALSPQAAELYPQILKDPSLNIPFNSLANHPSTSGTYSALNLKVLWQSFVLLAKLSPEGQQNLARIESALKGQGTSLEEILGALSGEAALSGSGLAQAQAEDFFAEPGLATVAARLARVPLVVTLGIQDKAKFDQLWSHFPQAEIGLKFAAQAYETPKKDKVYKFRNAANLYLAFTPQEILFSNNHPQEEVEALVARQAVKSWDQAVKVPGLAKDWQKGVFLAIQNMGANYGEMILGFQMAQKKTKDPQQLATLKALLEICKLLEKSVGLAVTNFKLEPQGLVLTSSIELRR